MEMEKTKAEAQAHHIRTFWRKLGYDVSTWVEPRTDEGADLIRSHAPASWTVRSNLRGGLPVGFKGTKQELMMIFSAFNSFDPVKG